jgi:hypothetical protein
MILKVTCEIGAKVPSKKFQAYSVAVAESTDARDIRYFLWIGGNTWKIWTCN